MNNEIVGIQIWLSTIPFVGPNRLSLFITKHLKLKKKWKNIARIESNKAEIKIKIYSLQMPINLCWITVNEKWVKRVKVLLMKFPCMYVLIVLKYVSKNK